MKRAVVTGMGVVAPNGLTVEEYWSAVLEGRSGIREVDFEGTNYSARFGGRIADFDDARHIPSRLLPQTDRMTRFALYAAESALRDADVDTIKGYDGGVTLSNAAGGFALSHRELRKLWSEGPKSVSAYLSFAWFYACNSGQLSIRHGLRGPGAALVAEQAGGLDAVGYSRRTVRRGTRMVLAGGVESALDPWGWLSHISSGRVTRATSAERAYLPFSEDSDGYVPGEGGAILVVEDRDAADERGAPKRYGEIAGYASTFDPGPGTGRPPGLRRASELALADAGLTPDAIDVVFADGAGSNDLDRVEADSIRGLFGPRAVPVSVPKALVGRLYSGGAPLDIATALLAIRDGVIPQATDTIHLPDDYGIDLVVGAPRHAPINNALVLARGRGGFNSAVVVTRAG
ncbi:ketosynthase chain-length factor [Streptomyces tsukubensis]|uniref:Ketosynthase chain-length factor n=1 Tax=Streptomyces tsukubensis TaxID=83656 RepID=A0A1V4AFR0_9ACTN|nr:ketosynthase chain-length factor [Streptomyces tsukubensis]OON82580.1 ketosynthase chain-length factor [Streptomyces tsukubensis]QFR92256.1 ketosynthase chain-length factor [Streptomyces tsukubensis]